MERDLRPPRSEDSFDERCSNPKCFMCIIRAPFLILKQESRTGVFFAWLAKLITIVDHFIGAESIRYKVFRIISENVEN